MTHTNLMIFSYLPMRLVPLDFIVLGFVLILVWWIGYKSHEDDTREIGIHENANTETYFGVATNIIWLVAAVNIIFGIYQLLT